MESPPSKDTGRIRICLLGDYSGHADEGMKKVASYLATELSKRYAVKSFDTRSLFSLSFWRELRRFRPQIIHYIPGVSILSFIIMKALSIYCPYSKSILSAMYPSFRGIRAFFYGPSFAISWLLQGFIPLARPNLLLVQSRETEEIFRRYGCRTQFLLAGVDINKFSPVSPENKARLREKHSIDKDKFAILHVGSIKKWRNVQAMGELQTGDRQVIVLGSSSSNTDEKICRGLEQRGCLVLRGYIEDVWELYALSDCYVFPVVDRAGSVEMPLSVLEAMACNLPVVSTRFGALQEVIEPGNGLVFVDSDRELSKEVERLRRDNTQISTREKVLPYCWEAVVAQLQRIYSDMVSLPANNEHGEI